MLYNRDKDAATLLARAVKLTPEEFVALAKVLGVKMSIVDKNTGEFTRRDAEEILEDIIVSFRKLEHKERKMILKVVNNSGPRT